MRNGGTSLVAPRSVLHIQVASRRRAGVFIHSLVVTTYETLQFITNVAPFGRFSPRTSLLRRVRDGFDDRSAHGADLFVLGPTNFRAR